MTVIDPAPAVARHLIEVIEEEGIGMKSPGGYSLGLYSSGDSDYLFNAVSALTGDL